MHWKKCVLVKNTTRRRFFPKYKVWEHQMVFFVRQSHSKIISNIFYASIKFSCSGNFLTVKKQKGIRSNWLGIWVCQTTCKLAVKLIKLMMTSKFTVVSLQFVWKNNRNMLCTVPINIPVDVTIDAFHMAIQIANQSQQLNSSLCLCVMEFCGFLCFVCKSPHVVLVFI